MDELQLTNADNVELEATFEQFTLNLVCDAVKAHMAFGYHRACCHIWSRHCQIEFEGALKDFDSKSVFDGS